MTPPLLPRLTAERPGDVYLLRAGEQHEMYWITIRNNADAVKWSRVPKPIDLATHHRWFRQSIGTGAGLKKRRLFIVMFRHPQYAEHPIGIGRIDHHGTWTELSIVLDPFFRGHGLGTRAIQALCAKVDEILWPTPGAVINGKNRRSLKTFLKAGFSLQARRWVELRRYKKRGA